jgi:hypothetical protein
MQPLHLYWWRDITLRFQTISGTSGAGRLIARAGMNMA